MVYLRLLLVLLAVASPAANAGDVPLFGQGDNDGMFSWPVSSEKLQAQPEWSPTAGSPPLSIQKAVRAAQDWIRAAYPEVKQFAVNAVTLAQVNACCESGMAKWYYRIDLSPVVGGKVLYGGQFTAVVRFDGSVVEPRKEKRVLVK
jgi:hypothetical protein